MNLTQGSHQVDVNVYYKSDGMTRCISSGKSFKLFCTSQGVDYSAVQYASLEWANMESFRHKNNNNSKPTVWVILDGRMTEVDNNNNQQIIKQLGGQVNDFNVVFAVQQFTSST